MNCLRRPQALSLLGLNLWGFALMQTMGNAA